MDEMGYIYATLEGNTKKKTPTIGFISHYDTSPDASGKDIKPRIIRNYDGNDIELSPGIISSTKKFPELLAHKGEDLIVTDGTTLLGADDKAGIAEIVQAMCYLRDHNEIKHGDIRVGFNPDEEIGMGAHHFDVEKFGCEWAYTIDGGDLGDLEYENFNAAGAKIHIKGVSVHTGYAKGKMINANRLACEFNSHIPDTDIPETTEGYQGFYHLLSIDSHTEGATLSYIIRDHDRDKFEDRKDFIEKIAKEMNDKYGEGTVTVDMKDQYYNMKEKIDPNMHVIDIVVKAMQETGVAPKVEPIRGGTDGAQLSFRGLPCPNIFAGGVNFHGPYEFVSIQVMEKAVSTIVKICELTAEYND
jgi:tripeptide aminopeptidase